MLSISYTDRNLNFRFNLADVPSSAVVVEGSEIEKQRVGDKSSVGALPVSGEYEKPSTPVHREQEYLSYLALTGRQSSELFPPNRVRALCFSCGEGVARFTGYKHHKIGDRKVYCANCHSQMGFPLRDVS